MKIPSLLLLLVFQLKRQAFTFPPLAHTQKTARKPMKNYCGLVSRWTIKKQEVGCGAD